MLERFPGELHDQPLLRIDPLDLDRRHREELGVETGDHLLIEVTATGIAFGDRPRNVWVLGELGPTSFRRFTDRVTAVDQEIPGRFGSITGTGQPSRQADDSDIVLLLEGGTSRVVQIVDVLGWRFRLPVDNPIGQGSNGWMLVGDSCRQHHPGELLDITGQGNGIAGSEPVLLHRAVDRYVVHWLPSGIGDPLPQPFPQLRDRYLRRGTGSRPFCRHRIGVPRLEGPVVGGLGGLALVVSHQSSSYLSGYRERRATTLGCGRRCAASRWSRTAATLCSPLGSIGKRLLSVTASQCAR